MSAPVTRRSALPTIAAATVAAALPAATLAAVHPDAALFAFHPRLKAAFRALNDAAVVYSDMQRRYWDATPREGWSDELRAAFGVDRAAAAMDASSDVWSEVVKEMLAMPAQTLDGIRFKLSVCHEQWDEPDLLKVIAGDIERIGGPIALWCKADADLDAPEARGGRRA